MLASPEGIFLASDDGSRLAFEELASMSPSDAKVNVADPDDEEANNRRTAGTSVDDEGRLYVKTPIGWSNLQLGPNLQIPYRE